MIITIDGPAGAGKSSVAKEIAKMIDFSYLDSGAIYRTLTLAVLRKGIDLNDEKSIVRVLKESNLVFSESSDGKKEFKAYIGKKDVSQEIRTPEVSSAVSKVSAHALVRKKLLKYQRDWAAKRNVVADGRDMGIRVFPEAEIKFFLKADPEERANRRYKELLRKGINVEYSSVLDNIRLRDLVDSTREASPLTIPKNAIIIDTTKMDQKEVVKKIFRIIKEKIN